MLALASVTTVVALLLPVGFPALITPVLVNPDTSLAGSGHTKSTLNAAEVHEVQALLRVMAHYSGSVDGVVNPQTVEAARRFEATHGRTVTGGIDRHLLTALRQDQTRQTNTATR